MATVDTITGPVDSAELGPTLMHEHIFVLTEGLNRTFPSVFATEARTADAVQRLQALYDSGVRTIVDLTVMGLGRDIELVRGVVEQTKLQVIVATGLYTYDVLPWHFRTRDADYMADLFVKDIAEGIGDTGVKAAILKCATDQQGVTEGVETVLRAVARAHRRTGVPISTHTHPASGQGPKQQDIFEEEGVDLSRVIIGHSGDTTDLKYLGRLIERGSYIGMDRFGIEAPDFVSLQERVDTIANLCALGRADRMVLAHDTSCLIDWFPEEMIKQLAPRWHYLHISQDVLPMLRNKGVSDEQIDQMLIGNPRTIFERQGAY